MTTMVRLHNETPQSSQLEPPPPGDIHLWLINADRPWHAGLKELLSYEEAARAARYALDLPRRQFAHTRGSLRWLLGHYLGHDPRALEFGVTGAGKPVLHSGELHFNVAHSGVYGVIAVARQAVGVDIETLRHVPNAAALVGRFFTPEEKVQFASLPDELKREGFFRGWTAKEALLKTIGIGLAGLNDCAVDLDPRNRSRVVRFVPGDWRLEQFRRDNLMIHVASSA